MQWIQLKQKLYVNYSIFSGYCKTYRYFAFQILAAYPFRSENRPLKIEVKFLPKYQKN